MNQRSSRSRSLGNLEFPQITLSHAIKLVTRVYSKKGDFQYCSRDELWKAMGFRRLSGASTKAMAALKRYNFVEPFEDGYRLTNSALCLARTDSRSRDWQAALYQAMLASGALRELSRVSQSQQLHDGPGLRNWVVTHARLNPKQAAKLVDIFLQNQAFVGEVLGPEGKSELTNSVT